MASGRHRMTIENLPGEILSEIFIRLKSKQLSQMRCVCKPWNDLLSESSFIKSHLHRSIHKNGEILLFFHSRFSIDCNPFTAHLSRSPNHKLTEFIKLPVNFHSKDRLNFGSVIGSVNGLICFCYRGYRNSSVHIWNPSLSALLTLPPPSLHFHNVKNICYQFGFDPITDDYKVVKLPIFVLSPNMGPQAEVYSMRKGSWKSISQRFPSDITSLQVQKQVCVDGHDGHIHWLGYNRKLPTILAFDLGAETFSEIPLPDSIKDYNVHKCYNVLGVLAGKLCVMSCVIDGGCEVWVMDEYGVAESWVKNHVFSQFSGKITPYGFTSNSEFLFHVNEDDNHFALYDPVTFKTKTFNNMSTNYTISKIVEYVDSLVWIEPAKQLQI